MRSVGILPARRTCVHSVHAATEPTAAAKVEQISAKKVNMQPEFCVNTAIVFRYEK